MARAEPQQTQLKPRLDVEIKPTNSGKPLTLGYLQRDLVRILWLAGILVAVQLMLWYLFNHSSFGEAFYRLVKL